ncbi:hypothetical protein Btru_032293 [Bulinus truncatus]|nr:hypothetical protein Btru_032293 [Bulinus truncatus]
MVPENSVMESVSSNHTADHHCKKSEKYKLHKSRCASKTKNKKSKRVPLPEVRPIANGAGSKWKLLFSFNQNTRVSRDTTSCFADDEWKFSSLILAWGRERLFHLLGLLSLLICAILFTLQAYLAFRSYQIMHQLNVKKHVPDMLYQFYFDSHEWSINLDKVDLRANTSIFIH